MKLLDNYGSIRKVNLLVIDMSSGRAMLASDALSDSLSVDVQHYTDAAFFFIINIFYTMVVIFHMGWLGKKRVNITTSASLHLIRVSGYEVEWYASMRQYHNCKLAHRGIPFYYSFLLDMKNINESLQKKEKYQWEYVLWQLETALQLFVFIVETAFHYNQCSVYFVENLFTPVVTQGHRSVI